MFQGRRSLALRCLLFFSLSTVAFYFYDTASTTTNSTNIFDTNDGGPISREQVSFLLSDKILNNEFPPLVHFSKDAGEKNPPFKVTYTLHEELQGYANDLLERYKPDYAAIVLMNARTGQILALNSFDKHKIYGSNLALKATYQCVAPSLPDRRQRWAGQDD